MVPIIGSMAIKGVFKAGSLISGLASTSGKLNEVQQRSKSTTTEMKRMTHGANVLKGALAAIGVAGFSALLMTTPQLAGALAKIKTNMQLIAWSIGKHLKPALEAVNTILTGIRTGNWSTVTQGMKDLASAALGLVATAGKWVIDLVFREGTYTKLEEDFLRWKKKLGEAWDKLDLKLILKVGIVEPVQWIGDKIRELQMGSKPTQEQSQKHLDFWKGVFETGHKLQMGTMPNYEGEGEGQTGLHVPKTGLYKLHAGETVTMKGSSGMDFEKSAISSLSSTKNESIENINNDFRKFDTITNRNESTKNESIETTINVDFSGANINLASGIELDQFAEAISMKIAEKQQAITY